MEKPFEWPELARPAGGHIIVARPIMIGSKLAYAAAHRVAIHRLKHSL